MEEKEIIGGNKLIAEFMGMVLEIIEHEDGTDYNWTNPPKNKHWPCKIEPPFDRSWDWLMPVVEKIEKSNFNNYDFNYNITGDGVCISKFDDGSGLIENINNVWGESKLEATYKCVTAFIKWYNIEKLPLPTF